MRARFLAAVVTIAVCSTQLLSMRQADANGSALGDVNNDTRVNSIDAFLLLQFKAGIICRLPPPQEVGCPVSQLGKGDVNEDGVANSLDATLILQYHAGLLAALPPPQKAVTRSRVARRPVELRTSSLELLVP